MRSAFPSRAPGPWAPLTHYSNQRNVRRFPGTSAIIEFQGAALVKTLGEETHAASGLGDPKILEDIEDTISLFDRCFKDKTDRGGYYSHIDPIALSPHAESLGHNRARKNWNSVGDHAPAYLINLWLATGRKKFADFLEYVFDTIATHFPDYNESPFVQERFFEDWSKDQSWGWQQNRAVVGHNLKIAWNLMRMASLKNKDSYLQLAERIAGLMPQVGMDKQRGGWYDVVERVLAPGEKFHRFAWHDRKAWWQQEQGILAYLLLAGVLKKPEYLRLARESSAFYNAWCLDVEDGGIHFNVLANGLPYALGTERNKGSHSMSGYHSFELAYLAATYTNLLITYEPMDLYFKPKPGGFADNILRVFPDILPAGSVKIGGVWIDGRPYENFDAAAGIVNLQPDHREIKVQVRLLPAVIAFTAEVVEVPGTNARLALVGDLAPAGIRFLEEALEQARDQGATAVTLELERLDKICSEALRYIIFAKQKLGVAFKFTIKGANKAVAAAIAESELGEEVNMLP